LFSYAFKINNSKNKYK